VRLAAALGWFWLMGVHRREGLWWLEQAMQHSQGVPAPVRASGHLTAARLAHETGERARGIALAGQSVALYREVGDKAGLAEALAQLGQFLRGEWCGEAWHPETYAHGTALLEEGLALAREGGQVWHIALCLTGLAATARAEDHQRAQAAAEEGLRLWQELGNVAWTGNVQRVLGWLALQAQDYARARAALTVAQSTMQQLGDTPSMAVVLSYLGDVARGLEDDAAAAALYAESLALYREFDFDQEHMARVLCRLGELALQEGDEALARDRYAESLRAAQEAGTPLRMAVALEALVELAVVQEQPQRAMRLAGAAAALRERTGQRLPEAEQAALARMLAPAVRALGVAQQAAAWAEGQATPLERVIADALS
jgi:hypothetical protein